MLCVGLWDSARVSSVVKWDLILQGTYNTDLLIICETTGSYIIVLGGNIRGNRLILVRTTNQLNLPIQ